MSFNLPEIETIFFSDSKSAKFVRVSSNVNIARLIEALDLGSPRSLLILNGGTAKIEGDFTKNLSKLFDELAFILIRERITVITGGSNAGIFSLFGKALQRSGGPTAPCIGITVAGRTTVNKLEPNHTHFILVEGDSWGDETVVMYRLADELAKNVPSLAMFAGGGEIAISEMKENVSQNREMILLAGSKGSTHKLIEAKIHRDKTEPRFDLILSEGRMTEFNINGSLEEFKKLIYQKLIKK